MRRRAARSGATMHSNCDLNRRALLCRTATLAATLATSSLGAPHLARAQTTAPLRILCTAPGGTVPDIVARRYAEQLSARYPGGVIVDNRAGAAGRIAVAALKAAPPDGNTWLLAQGAVATVYPHLYDKLTYDPVADLRPLSVAAEAVLGLAVGPAVPDNVATLAQLVEWLRNHPAQAAYGSPGVGTLPHLMVALLAREARLELTHVPFAAGPAALVELMAGRLSVLALPEGLLRPLQAAGKLRVLATSGASRSSFPPGVASVGEQGYPKLVMREWFGFFMPTGAAAATLETASQSIRQAALQGPLRAALAESGMLAVSSTPADMAERIAAEQPYWRGVIQATGIRAE
jgi:tripartite-type tricarboxylate transporter receptor subunit TctC